MQNNKHAWLSSRSHEKVLLCALAERRHSKINTYQPDNTVQRQQVITGKHVRMYRPPSHKLSNIHEYYKNDIDPSGMFVACSAFDKSINLFDFFRIPISTWFGISLHWRVTFFLARDGNGNCASHTCCKNHVTK